MIEVSFEINGRRVNPQNARNELEKAIYKQVEESIKKRVGTARCPEHGTAPKIVCKGHSLDSLSFEVSGCCDKLIDAVKAKLK